jgi:probable addiction module antidote protein
MGTAHRSAHRRAQAIEDRFETLHARRLALSVTTVESGDADFVRDAPGLVARARGMSEIAKKAGLNREVSTRRLGKPAIPNSARSCASSVP